MSNIAEHLKEATNDLLTDDALQQIEEAFNKAVDDKVSLHVEKALLEQDEEYSTKLEKLLEAVDTDHTKKMQRVVEAINTDHAGKLRTIIKKYESTVNEEAKGFKGELVNTISNYIDVYLEEKLPVEDIQTAVRNRKAVDTLETLRETLGVDFALAHESIRSAVVDGKNQINESSEENEALKARNEKLTRGLINAKAHILLETKTKELTPTKKKYIFKVLAGKSEKFIAENFDYTLKLFEKTEEERLEKYKEQAEKTTKTANVDRPIVEKVDVAAKQVVEEAVEKTDYVENSYMDALKKY
jgi:hypothetical protein